MYRLLAQLALFAAMAAGTACGGSGSSILSPSSAVNFQGVWQGSWQRASCTETGGTQGFACSRTPTSGSLRITLTQSDEEVQGSVEVDSFFIPVSGSVNSTGALSISGQAHLQEETGTLSNWSTTRSGNSMNGAFTLTIVPDISALGSAVFQLTLQNVTKTS